MAHHTIVGLGVSGLACARELLRLGSPFVAYEKEGRPGGLARTTRLGPFRFDWGPHFLLHIPSALEAYSAELGIPLEKRGCRSAILLGRRKPRLVPTPLQRNLWRLPSGKRLQIAFDLLVGRLWRPARGTSYDRYARSVCGKTIYESFIEGYESKRLRYSLSDIDARWATRLVLPTLRSLMAPPSGNGACSSNGEDGTFHYPVSGGIEALPGAMGRVIPQEMTRYNKELVQIDPSTKTIRFQDGQVAAYKTLILSLPLPEIVAHTVAPPHDLRRAAASLVSTSIYLVRLGLDSLSQVDYGVLRCPDSDVDFYRVSLPSRYCPSSAPRGCDSVTAEIAFHPSRFPISKDEARKKCIEGLKKIGLIGADQRILVEQIVEIPCAHVVYNMETIGCVQFIREYLARHSIFTCGKYAQWKDMLMPQSMMSGIETAHRVCKYQGRDSGS